jgi:DNA-directed RNA polymerase subunit RPC12/RpoP
MRTTARFNYFNSPPCAKCGTGTMPARRELHPSYGSEFELVTYECPKCGHKEMRKFGPSQDE